jgi:hypothetical protein
MLIGFQLLSVNGLMLLFQIKFPLSIANYVCILAELRVIMAPQNKSEVNDEKSITNIFSCPFPGFFFGAGLCCRKNCPVEHTRLFRLKLQQQDRCYPEEK